MLIRAVVFDAYGTTVRIEAHRRPFLRLFRLAAVGARRAAREDGRRLLTTNASFLDVAAELGVDVTSSEFAGVLEDLAVELRSVSAFSESVGVMAKLRAEGVQVAICSNLAQAYAAPVLRLLPGLDAYIWSFAVGATKPHPAIYAATCEALGRRAEEVLFVGDSYAADVAGPRSFGMRSVHLARAGTSPGANFIRTLDAVFDHLGAS